MKTKPKAQLITDPSLKDRLSQRVLRFLSVCSGMEAASVAWEPLGWKAVGFSEIEPFPCAILKHRFPNTPNHGSLTEYKSWPIEPGAIDLLVGGTPCQSFSVAGLRKGMQDPRGNLALTFLGLADKLRPRWIVWENVPGVLSSNGGRDFGSFLGALGQLGYGWAYRVLDAQYFGVPQRRRRVFVVASLGGRELAASVLLKPESVCWHPAKGRKKGQATAPDAGSGVEAGNGCWWDGGQVSQTLDAVLQKGQTMPEKNRFPAVLQSVCATGDLTHCLTKSHHGSEDGTGRGTPIVIDRAAFNQGINAQYEPHIEQTDVMDSLVARGPHAVGVPFRKSKRAQSAVYPINTLTLGGRPDPVNDARMTLGVGADGDPQFTLQAAHSHAVATTIAVRTAQTSANGIGVADNVSHTLDQSNGQAVLTPSAMAVRRLTPTECERLQGFPDNWSRIPWKGKPEDQCPDGPRYKACGNSMAVPVMRWIGEQIARVELSHNPTNQTNA